MTDEINLTERPEDTIRRLANDNIALRAIAESKRLAMRPGDRIVCKVNTELDTQHVDELRARLHDILQIPDGVQLVICDSRIDLDEQADMRQLAAGILAAFTKTGDGWRARAGQVQISRWRDQLGDQQ